MTNYEYYRKDIERYTRLGLQFAIDKNSFEVVSCRNCDCGKCIFIPEPCNHPNNFTCDDVRLRWADKEYIETETYEEHEVDWSKVLVDTPIWVRESEKTGWHPRHFAKFEDGFVYAWDNGATSFTADDASTMWNYAKLAGEQENESQEQGKAIEKGGKL